MASENKKRKISKGQGKCWSFLKYTKRMRRVAFFNATLRKRINKIDYDSSGDTIQD